MATRGRTKTDLPEGGGEGDGGVVDEQGREWRAPVVRKGVVGHSGMHEPPDDDELPEQAPADRLASMLEEAAGVDKALVRVYRVGEPGKPLDWCANYSVADFESGGDLSLIRAQFGPGRYSIRIHGPLNDGTRRTGLLSRVDVGIIADPATPKPALLGNPVQGGTDLAQLAAILQDGQRQVLEAVTRVTQQPQVDPMVQMTQMFGLMKLMREAMGMDTKPAQTPISEILATIRELKEASAELGGKEPEPEPSLMQLGAQVLGMVKDRVATPPFPPPAMPVVPVQVPPSLQAAPPFPPIASDVEPTPQAVQAPVATPVASPTPAADAEPDEPDQAAEIARVRGLFERALQLAQSGAPAEQGAELLYGTDESDGLPDEMFGLMILPNWWDLLVQIPELATALRPHEAWIRKVRDLMLQWMAEDEGEVGAPSHTV